ncbi:MAG: hypothetical protein GF331_22870 [Chitinivibrionales bacterium]|nr:hypothetical protein [Chitinivibrionales bacterium]
MRGILIRRWHVIADYDYEHLDIVAGQPWSPKSVTIYYNDGAGGFGLAQALSSTKGLYSGVVVDIGNDGDMDIVGQEAYAGSSKPWLYESLLDEQSSVLCP